MFTSQSTAEKTKDGILEIYALGRFHVRCNGQELFAESGRSQKTGELFMYLITHRWKPAAPEIILESLKRESK